MPIEWIPVAVKAAVGAATSAAVREAYAGAKSKVSGLLSDALSKGPLAEPLEAAYREGFSGFCGSLAVAFPIDEKEIEQGLQALASLEDFTAIVGQLPFVPFDTIDTARARELFLNLLGPEGMEDRDFEAAWRAFGLRFERAAAKDQGLKNLLDLTRGARQEKREKDQLQAIKEIKELLQSLAASSPQSPDPEPALRKYRESLYQRYRYADTRGLFLREKEGVGEGIELRQVFVETLLARILEQKKEREGKEREGKKERLPEEAPQKEVRKLGEILARERLFVVLGAPGSGKSTLLRCLCLTLCRPDGVEPLLEHSLSPEIIPVLLPLKEFASALRETSNLELDNFLLERLGGQIPGLEDFLNNGRALVLLDGLDEVFDESHRHWVSDEVWRLVSRFPETHFVLTSRLHGYQAAPLPGPVPRWELQSFGEEEISRFLRGWFEALAKEGSEAGAEEPPQKRAEALTSEILARPNLTEMAQNPLLCTLIVLVHRSRSGRLPERRVLFYEAAVRTFAEVWERSKYYPKQEGQEKLDIPKPEILRRALAEVAWRALHQLESREIPGPELRTWLLDYLNREPAWRGERGERAVRDLLSLVRDRIGLLVDLGGDRYQFVHLSLHEWLVSDFLLDRLKEEARKKVVRHYLHAPEWEEVLRLLIAGAPQAQADELIQDIHSRPTGDWENRLRRDLRFIHRCLADQAPIGPETRQSLDSTTAAALCGSDLLDLPGFLRDLADTGFVVRRAVLSRLGDRDWRVRSAAVEYLSRVGVDNPETRRAVLSRLGDEYGRVRNAAVGYFSRVGMADPETRRAVLSRLGDKSWRVRIAAVEYFSGGGVADPETCRAVLSRLDDEDGSVRSAAVGYFSRVGVADPETRRAVLSRLGDEDASVRSAAVEYFSRVGVTDPETRRAVLSRLGDEYGSVRNAAVNYFSRDGVDGPETRRAFLSRLGDENWSVRSAAVEYFSRVGVYDPETRQAVLSRLGDEYGSVRSAAVKYFSGVGVADPETRLAVLSRLGDEHRSVSSAAVEYFSRVGVADPETRLAVLSRLGDENWSVRSAAVEYFSRVGADDSETRRAVLSRLGDEDWSVRSAAVEYFSRVGADDSETRRAVLSRLGDEEWSVRSAAVEYFSRVGVADPETRRAVLSRLSDEYGMVRSAAVEHFSRVGVDDSETRRAVLSCLGDKDEDVRAAVLRFSLGGGFDEDIALKLLEKFREISSTTSEEHDLRFSEMIGNLAATGKRLKVKLIQQGPSLPNFHMGSALRALAAEEDRLRRQANHLRLSIPGCEPPEPPPTPHLHHD